MRLQCFPPTRYVGGGASRAHKRDDLYQLLTKLKFRLPGALYGSTMHPARLCGGFWTIFFCLVFWSPCYTLSRKKYRKVIHRGVESTWGDNFYMGTLNGLKLEI